MKTLKLTVLLLFAGCALVSAQSQKLLQTIRISTPTVQCEMCKKRIENYLRREDGIQSVNVNYRLKYTTVKYFSDRTNPENIRTAIANTGYDADTVAANPDYYATLPACCKKGGMDKPKKH